MGKTLIGTNGLPGQPSGPKKTYITNINGEDGKPGEDAYQIAVENGFEGTEIEWLESLEGLDGTDAYSLALLEGFIGTRAEWLASLKGDPSDINRVQVEELDTEVLREAKEHADNLTVDWDNLEGKPLAFPPSPHTHTIEGVDDLGLILTNKSDVGHKHTADDISGLPAAPDVNKAYVDNELTKKSPTNHTHSFDSLTSRPTSYPPSAHKHSASDVESGVFPPTQLGTGTPNSTKVLFGDGAWKDAPTGGGSTPVAVTFATGSVVTNQDYTRGQFLNVRYSIATATNVGGGVWDGSSIWYAPITGTYLLVGSIRFPDDIASMAFSTGIHTGTGDGPHGLWTFSAPPTTRPMVQYTRILRVTAGTGLMQYLYQLGPQNIRLIPSGFGCSWSATLLSAG